MVFVGIVSALAASALFNLGVAVQALDARVSPRYEALRLSLIKRLVHKRRWVAGLLIGGLGFPFEVLAFAKAPFVVVQPLLATGLLDHYIWSMFHFGLVTWGGMGIALSSASDRLDAPAKPDSE